MGERVIIVSPHSHYNLFGSKTNLFGPTDTLLRPSPTSRCAMVFEREHETAFKKDFVLLVAFTKKSGAGRPRGPPPRELLTLEH